MLSVVTNRLFPLEKLNRSCKGMGSYSVRLKRSAEKDLRRIDKGRVLSIIAAIEPKYGSRLRFNFRNHECTLIYTNLMSRQYGEV
ncbi:Unannotated [Lentimonas sp. CC19]|nr:Unannotated [Lentimonas sp. CC4]CAA6684432.1 Unannotated [Lentimonas sp. CC6]CAA6692822.1 Unannotated [Lentimonas sp. CC19]CAA6695020.1 Unannotated [Lentimonas sp. CC10]CAA7069633.1 Unannotated [Lentimonas sp. CC11]CAA7171323.1 Unannotated [Lentimonas sp. CC21]CAA7183353.1 Unannotated [Lentimonas sp. CC8]